MMYMSILFLRLSVVQYKMFMLGSLCSAHVNYILLIQEED